MLNVFQNKTILFFTFLCIFLIIIFQVFQMDQFSISYNQIISLNSKDRLSNRSFKMIKKSNRSSLPTIFCLIKTHPNNIKINKTLNVYRVWAHKCDNYRFVTKLPDHLQQSQTNDLIEVYENFYMIQPYFMSSESHGNLTLKIYYSMVYIYKKLPSYDWYYIVDDDAYVNMLNLKNFLKDKPKNESITYGYNFKVIVKDGYHSGGPGYALSNKAFVTMAKEMEKNIQNCPNTGIDDVDVNDCVRKFNGTMGQSRDENGRERFLPMSLMDHFKGNNIDWLNSYGQYPPVKGLNCCSDSLVAVHYMSPRDVFRLDLAIDTQRNNFRLYDQMFGLNKPITFKNILKNYILLDDIEKDSNMFKQLIDF